MANIRRERPERQRPPQDATVSIPRITPEMIETARRNAAAPPDATVNIPRITPDMAAGQGAVPPAAGTQGLPPVQPPAGTAHSGPSIPIAAPPPPAARPEWERDRAIARQMGRGIQRRNNGSGPVQPIRPLQRGEDLGVSAVTAEFSLAAVREAMEEQSAAQKPETAAPKESPEAAPTPEKPAQQAAAAPVRERRPRRPRQPAKTAQSQALRYGSKTRAEAEAELYQSVHDDHLWLNNPIMVRGLGLAPAIVAAVNGRSALLLCAAAVLLLTATRVLAVALCHLLGRRQRPLLYLLSAAVLYVPAYCLLYRMFGSELTVLGIYLPMLVADPAIIKRMEAPELETVGEALERGVNNTLGLCISLLLIGMLRELLAAGTVFGAVVMADAPLPLASQPAGGFMLVGLLAAVWTAVGGAYVHYKREEVRHLYADRKQ